MSNELINGFSVTKAGRKNDAATGATYRVNVPRMSNASIVARKVNVSGLRLVSVSDTGEKEFSHVSESVYVLSRMTLANVHFISLMAREIELTVTRLNNSSITLRGDNTGEFLKELNIPVYTRRLTSIAKLEKDAAKEVSTDALKLNATIADTHKVMRTVGTNAYKALVSDARYTDTIERDLLGDISNAPTDTNIATDLTSLLGDLTNDIAMWAISRDNKFIDLANTYSDSMKQAEIERATASEILTQISDLRSEPINAPVNRGISWTFYTGETAELNRLELQSAIRSLERIANRHAATAIELSQQAEVTRKLAKDRANTLGRKYGILSAKEARAKQSASEAKSRANRADKDAEWVETEKLRVSLAVNRKRVLDARALLLDAALPLDGATETQLFDSVNALADKARDTATGENIKAMQEVAKNARKMAKEVAKQIDAIARAAKEAETTDAKIESAIATHSETRI